MKLEFLHSINEYNDQLIRLYDFDKAEAALFRDAVKENLLNNKSLDLSSLPFIEAVNCKLILHLAEEDEGIMTQDDELFFCDLTMDGYKNMLRLIEPFCNKDLRNFQQLYELDTQIDFLFSPSGQW